jgi:hypothetical protein
MQPMLPELVLQRHKIMDAPRNLNQLAGRVGRSSISAMQLIFPIRWCSRRTALRSGFTTGTSPCLSCECHLQGKLQLLRLLVWGRQRGPPLQEQRMPDVASPEGSELLDYPTGK